MTFEVMAFFVCHAYSYTIGLKSRASLEREESLAKDKGVLREEESEGSLTAKVRY